MITICCPSRGRPDLAQRMALSALNTAQSKNDVEVKFYLNDDDEFIDQYIKILDTIKKTHPQIDYTIGKDQSPVKSWNEIAESSMPDMAVLIGDDVQFVTPNWDHKFRQAYNKHPDGIMCISFNDGKRNQSSGEGATCPHPVTTRQWFDSVGYYFAPYFWHWYVDTYTRDLAVELGRFIYLNDVTLKVKKIIDETGSKVRTHGIPQRDKWLFEKLKQKQFYFDLECLKKGMTKN